MFEHASDDQVLPCRIKLAGFARPAEYDYCGACFKHMRDNLAEGDEAEVAGLDERAYCDRCGHPSAYGRTLDRVRAERERLEQASDERARRRDISEVAGLKRRPWVKEPAF